MHMPEHDKMGSSLHRKWVNILCCDLCRFAGLLIMGYHGFGLHSCVTGGITRECCHTANQLNKSIN